MKLSDIWNEADGGYLKSIGYASDNPGGDWLKGQQERASHYYPRTTGANTATIGLFRPALGNVSYFIDFPGELGEEKHRHTSVKRDSLAQSVAKNGWLEEEATIMVFVNYKGEVRIGEGNHRLAYAYDHGIEWIGVDIRYFAGGERMDGPLMPTKLTPKIIKPSEQ